MKLSTLALTLGAALSIGAAFTAPAMALDGRHAVGLCIDNPKCSYTVDKAGGIDIMVNGHWVSCPGATKECTAVDRTGGKTTVSHVPVESLLRG